MIPPQVVTYNNLRGINTYAAITNFKPTDAILAVGGHFSFAGAFTKRKGGEKYNTTPLPAPITTIGNFIHGSTSEIIITAGTSIYKGNGGSPVAILTGITDGAVYYFATYSDYYWMTNGSDEMKKYDGTTVTNAGIKRPTTVPTATVINSGTGHLAAGTYRIRFTFVNDSNPNFFIESNPSNEITCTIPSANAPADIRLTDVAVSSDTQVTKRYIYMSSAGGAVLSYNTQIPDNTSTTIDITSNSSGALLEYDHDTPPKVKYLTVWKDRLFGAIGNTLYFSKDFDVAYWPQGELDQSTIFTIIVGDSSPITGIAPYYDQLLVFKQYEIYSLSGNNEYDFTLSRISPDSRIGCISHYTIRVIDNWCYFLGANSVYRTNGVYIQDVANNIQDFFDPNGSMTTYRINKEAYNNAWAISYKVKPHNWYLLFVPTENNTENNMCFMMDCDSLGQDVETGNIVANWAAWPGFTTQAACIVRENNKDTWFRGDSLGYVWRQERLDGDGSNITSKVTGATSNTLTDEAQSWTTNLYAGCYVYIIDGKGNGQRRLISSNTSNTLTLTSNWETIPDETSTYSIGGIPYSYEHFWDSYGNPTLSKRLLFIRPRFDAGGSFPVNIYYGYDFIAGESKLTTVTLPPFALWDQAIWDLSYWDGVAIIQNKYRVPGSRIHRWSNLKIENNAAGQNIKFNGYDKIFQLKGIR